MREAVEKRGRDGVPSPSAATVGDGTPTLSECLFISTALRIIFAACVAIATCATCAFADDDVGTFVPDMEIPGVVTNGVKWIDGRFLPIEGRAFDGTEHYYDRLPTNVTASVNGTVRTMKHHTAGMQFRFATDSRTLVFKWVPYNAGLEADNMAASGASGIDVYRFDAESGRWLYAKTGRISSSEGGSLSLDWTPGTPCLVNLPLFNGIREFSLGIEPEATVTRLSPHRGGDVKPVVFYGSSSVQGLGASRPGMSFVNIVGRMLDVPVVNLGFSGGCLMELEMSDHLAAIDAGCYVLDCGDDTDVTAACEPFIRNLRAKRPDVPIVMAEKLPDDEERSVDDDALDDCGMMALAEAHVRALKKALWHDLAWVDESVETASLTGTWAPAIAYDPATRKAELHDEHMFTPGAPSGGNPVTLEVTATFGTMPEIEDMPKAGTQGAIWIGTNGCFQVWTSGGWVDVVTEGVTPQPNVDYTFRFTFDYDEGTYGVEVRTGLTGFARLRERANPVRETFPLATSGSGISKVCLRGRGALTSIVGNYVAAEGFAENDEVLLKDNASVILDAARAVWLNSCAGGKTAVGNAAAVLSADDFDNAYLLNLDITGENAYSFRITSVNVAADKVTVGVTLTRTGKVAQKTNGVLKFYGAATVDAFATAKPVPATISNDGFPDGDTATAEIPLTDDDPPAFFKAKIEEGR